MRALLRTGRVGMEDRWFGNAFQIFEATDENDLEAAMVVYVEERILRKTKKSVSKSNTVLKSKPA